MPRKVSWVSAHCLLSCFFNHRNEDPGTTQKETPWIGRRQPCKLIYAPVRVVSQTSSLPGLEYDQIGMPWIGSQFIFIYVYICMCVCVHACACVSLCVQCVCWYAKTLEDCTLSPGAGFTTGCELQMWMLKIRLRSSARASIHLTTESPLQPVITSLCQCIFCNKSRPTTN